jgi:hypothetical protein
MGPMLADGPGGKRLADKVKMNLYKALPFKLHIRKAMMKRWEPRTTN